VIEAVVVVLDEGADLGLQVGGRVIVFQPDAVLQDLTPELDLAQGLGSPSPPALRASPCGQEFWSHLRSFVTSMRPKPSSKRNLQSVSKTPTADRLGQPALAMSARIAAGSVRPVARSISLSPRLTMMVL